MIFVDISLKSLNLRRINIGILSSVNGCISVSQRFKLYTTARVSDLVQTQTRF